MTGSLRQLVEKSNMLKTKKCHEIAFKAIVNELTSDKLLRYCKPLRKLFLDCDASGLGVGFTLLQNFCTESDDEEVNLEYLSKLFPIVYCSCTFSECE